MSSLFDPRNPNADNHLRRLMGDLPGMVKSMQKGRNGRSQEKGFKRFCPICCLMYDRAKLWSTDGPTEKHCKGCQKNLDDGYTALVTMSHRWAFVKHPQMQPGTVIKVKDETMDKIEAMQKKGGEKPE